MPPIFLLAGPPAVGKSTTAHALAARYPKSIHIPVDDLREMVVSGLALPGTEWSPGLIEQLALARESAVQMALAYHAAGFAVTVDDFWDPHSRLEEYAALGRHPDAIRVLLLPDLETAEARNRKRSGPGQDNAYIAEGIQAVYRSLAGEVGALEQAGWFVADTSGQDIESVVAQILQRAG